MLSVGTARIFNVKPFNLTLLNFYPCRLSALFTVPLSEGGRLATTTFEFQLLLSACRSSTSTALSNISCFQGNTNIPLAGIPKGCNFKLINVSILHHALLLSLNKCAGLDWPLISGAFWYYSTIHSNTTL